MPKARSKAQQRLFFALANRGVISKREARARAVKGKVFNRLPARRTRKRRSRRRRRRR